MNDGLEDLGDDCDCPACVEVRLLGRYICARIDAGADPSVVATVINGAVMIEDVADDDAPDAPARVIH